MSKYSGADDTLAQLPVDEIVMGVAGQRSNDPSCTAIDHASPLVLGDSMLDQDHAGLSRLVQALLTASGGAAVAALDTLRVEAGEHFDREDADLRILGGNNAACHLDEHAAVLRSLDEVRAILRDEATSPEIAQRLTTSLAFELQRWLPEHVSEMDASLAAVRCRSRFGGAPLRLVRAEHPQRYPSRVKFESLPAQQAHESKI